MCSQTENSDLPGCRIIPDVVESRAQVRSLVTLAQWKEVDGPMTRVHVDTTRR